MITGSVNYYSIVGSTNGTTRNIDTIFKFFQFNAQHFEPARHHVKPVALFDSHCQRGPVPVASLARRRYCQARRFFRNSGSAYRGTRRSAATR